jgi:anti-sigma regulatory factor (Ser/Thr protein kinase)
MRASGGSAAAAAGLMSGTKEINWLRRVAFRTSRILDVVGQRELTAQLGHRVESWPLVVLKELLDNALDAAEEAEIVPLIAIDVSTAPGAAMIRVVDNGPGIAPGNPRHSRLCRPRFVARGLLLADPRRSGQCAQDDRADGLRPRRPDWRDLDWKPRP